MFSKKCPKCRNKISKKYDFCPYCGNNSKLKYDKEDYGFLGKNDLIEENFFQGNLEETSIMDKMLDNAFKTAERILEKHMKNISQEMMRNPPQAPRNHVAAIPIPNNVDIQFFVNGERVFPENSRGENINKKPIKIKNNISNEKAEKFSKLPKKEPNSRMKRLSGRLIYELEVPGVENINDVLINQLENSIEIKALGKDKVYSKILNVNLPILGYSLDKNSLILELQARN